VEGKVTANDIAAVKLAQHFIGTQYQWGGSSPKTGFDCSGLLQYVWGTRGVQIPRTTYEQFQSGQSVGRGQLRAGDAVFFKGSDSQGGLPGHVGIYIGNGKYIEAPHTGATVKVSLLKNATDYQGARRYG
jgi:cell wall-associated NlpC family hydrolase